MNVIIADKRRDGGTSFIKLISYISDRGDRPLQDELLTEEPSKPRSESKQAVFDRLVDYIDRADSEDAVVTAVEEFPDGRQRVMMGGVACETNCLSLETAAAEMNHVASQNTRCLDPVYHFILSWRENELPTDAQIFECAQHCIKVLGMEGHQYVTAIHQDTDNTHCHIAVNRVNPDTLRAANLWNDADELQKACRVLERRYGFEQDNGSWAWGHNDQLVRVEPGFEHAPEGAVQREVYSDKESLFHYSVRTVREDLDQAIGQGDANWDHLHLLLHTKGLGVREQGKGLVVYDALRPDAPVVKASSVHPYFTKANLEPVYGEFKPSVHPPAGEAMRAQVDVLEVYMPDFQSRDRGDRFERREQRAQARRDLKKRHQDYKASWIKPDLNIRARLDAINVKCRAAKREVRDRFNDPLLRKLMYRAAEFQRMQEQALLRIQIRQERQALFEQGLLKPLAYRPWVEQQALAGDVAAVSQLRGFAYREKRNARKADAAQEDSVIFSPADDTPMYDRPYHASQMKRDGTIEYLRYGQVGVVDSGDEIRVMPGFDAHDDAANKRLAIALSSFKSGEHVVLEGDEHFVASMVNIAQQFNERFSETPVHFTVQEQQQLLDGEFENRAGVEPQSDEADARYSDISTRPSL